jgi:hypothetical protein
MDCTRAKSLLSEHADGLLDKETCAAVEEHLSSCAECRKEAKALQSLIQDLRSLPSVAPPTDFLRQLHKRMEQPSRFRRVLEKIFFPVKFKIPLQLAGAVLAALLVFSVYTVQQEEHQATKTTRSMTREKAAKRQVAMADKAATPAEKPAAGSAGLKKEEPLIELTLLFGKTALAPQSAVPPTTSSFEGKSTDGAREAPRAGIQAAPARVAEKADDRGDPVRKAVAASQGRILSEENEKEGGQPAFILAEVPSDKLPVLFENLRQLGEVRLSQSLPSDEARGPVKIRVRILPND